MTRGMISPRQSVEARRHRPVMEIPPEIQKPYRSNSTREEDTGDLLFVTRPPSKQFGP